MTQTRTDELIRSLSQDLAPVRVLAPPGLRAFKWLAAVAAALGIVIALRGHVALFVSRLADPRMAVQCAATLVTGITAVVAAFHLSLPDRPARWRLAPLAPLVLWILTSGAGCLRYGVGLGPPGSRLGLSPHCFLFIVGVSIPLAAILFPILRRSRPLEPLAVAVMGSLGVAALAAFVLQFFHEFDTTWIDLAVHGVAVAAVVAVSAGVAAAGRVFTREG